MGLTAGDRVDRYEVVGLLGSGGMGEVYRARDPKLARLVALKILRPDQALGTDGSARLVREARAAAALSHANVLAVFDVGEVQEPESLRGLPYIAMELVVGRSLRTYLGDESVPMERRVGWLRDVAVALGAAHQAGIVHRDVKPENVMIRVDGAVKVLDFGIAQTTRRTFDAWSSTLGHSLATAATGAPTGSSSGVAAIAGTPLYMAPEQLRGEEVDGRADQFSWGVMAYWLLTGRPPWNGPLDAVALLSQVLSYDPPAPREVDGAIPGAVSEAIVRALAKRRESRFASMDDLVVALGEPPAPGPARGEVVPRRSRLFRYVLSACAALLAASVALIVSSKHRSPPDALHAATVATPSAIPITEEPLPSSPTPGALEAYAGALRELRIGSLDAARKGLESALELDPGLAAAHLRLLPIDMELHRDPAPSYRRVTQLRGRLSERDRELLDAFAPLVESDPVDFVEISRRLARLSASHPNDAEVAGYLAYTWFLRYDCEIAKREADRAVALDPEFGFARMVTGECERLEGAFDKALADDRECFARVGAIDCLVEESWTAQFVGAPDALSIARKLQTLDPESWEGARGVAGGLFVQRAPMAAIRLALEAGRPQAPFREPATGDYVAGLLAMAAGEFTEARRLFGRARQAAATIRALQASLTRWLVEVDEESGDDAAALDDAQTFVAAMPAFSGARTRGVADPIPFILHVMLEHGKLSLDDYRRARAELVDGIARRVGPVGRAQLWTAAYAAPARTPDEAREALAAIAELGEPRFSFSGAPVGSVRLLSGDARGALPDLERGARASDVFFDPVVHMHAVLDLGRARERSGDVAGACEAYETVVAVWGKAAPRSISAEESARRLGALACTRVKTAAHPPPTRGGG